MRVSGVELHECPLISGYHTFVKNPPISLLAHHLSYRKPSWCTCVPEIVLVAAPRVIPGIMDRVGLHRVEVDVANDRCQLLIGTDKNGLVAAPKQGAIPSVSSIKSLGIDTINMTHGSLEVSLWCLKG